MAEPLTVCNTIYPDSSIFMASFLPPVTKSNDCSTFSLYDHSNEHQFFSSLPTFITMPSDDDDDDGAFPEIFFEPHPLGMGRKANNDDPVCSSNGNVAFDATAGQGENAEKIVAIPLDKRPAADRRELQEVQVNDNFATLWEALYVAEQKARDAITLLEQVQKELMLKEKDKKEQDLRALAQKSRSERTGIAAAHTAPAFYYKVMADAVVEENNEQHKETREERDEMLQRDKIREEPRCGEERERRLEPKDSATVKKSKLTRDRYRDVGEKVDLGVGNVGEALRFVEVINDHWLFDQDKGMESGFAADDPFSVYDNGLFTAQSALSSLCRPKKDVDMYGGAEDEFDEVMKTEMFKPDMAFAGAERRPSGRKRDRPVEFDKQEDDDPFGLNELIAKATRKPLDKIGGGGTMKASAGSSMREIYEREGSGSTHNTFERRC